MPTFITLNKVFLFIGFIFALLATLIAGGVVTASGLTWLLPAAITAFILAFLFP